MAIRIGYSIAGQKALFPWGVGAGEVVAYLDGEMRAETLQGRMRQTRNCDTRERTAELAMRNFHIINRSTYGDVLGFIDIEADQLRIEEMLPEGCALLIVDNLSAWTSSGREDGAAFAPIKCWLARLRTKGIAVLLVHHTGKQGNTQRGTSIHEDMLDYSILLSADKKAKPKNGTSFLLEHTKLRELHPDLPQTCRFTFTTDQATDVMHLASEDCEFAVNPLDAEIIKLLTEGKSGMKIAKDLGVQRSKVSRIKTALAAQQQAQETDGQTDQGADDEA